MSTETIHGVVLKVFIGHKLTSELKMALSMSESWKRATDHPLDEVQTDNGAYIGIAIDSSIVPMHTLKQQGTKVVECLQKHCPEVKIELGDLCTFPQVFLA